MIMMKLKHVIVGIMWAMGLLAAGSDSDYMPWANMIGVAVFAAASWIMSGGHVMLKSLTDKHLWDSGGKTETSYSVTAPAAIYESSSCRPAI